MVRNPIAIRIDCTVGTLRFYRIRYTVTVRIVVKVTRNAIAILVKQSFGGIKNTVVVGICIKVIRHTVTIHIRIRQGTGSGRVIQPITIGVGEAVNYTIAVGVCTTGFNDIVESVSIRIKIKVIRSSICICIKHTGCFYRVIDAVIVSVCSAGDINIIKIIYPVTIGIETTTGCFIVIRQAVVVGIEIQIVRDTIGIGINTSFNGIGNTVRIGVKVDHIRHAIPIGVNRCLA